MARKPNYSFERMERDRLKALKTAEKANAKKRERELAQGLAQGQDDVPPGEDA
jgi:hypothetical protein